MIHTEKSERGSPLSSEQACISYLFKKRWPWGFICPFCGAVQQEIAPAYTVVCRYCRKQTSITAKTLMHGSKKSLAAWMRVAWQFCATESGLSARKLQQMMELSCYHTAWNWLQKLRLGAALAESAPCSSPTLVQPHAMSWPVAADGTAPVIVLVMEVADNTGSGRRIRFATLTSTSNTTMQRCMGQLVAKGSTLLLADNLAPWAKGLHTAYTIAPPSSEQLQQGQEVFEQSSQWLAGTYRGAVDSRYLQNYLDEFSFRYNTASWPDRLTVLDHLLSGLVKAGGNSSTKNFAAYMEVDHEK